MAHWVAHLERNIESATAMASRSTAHAGAVAVDHARTPAGGASGSFSKTVATTAAAAGTRKWLFAACAAVIGVTTVSASPVLYRSGRTFYRIHMTAHGSASAESTSAGMIDTIHAPAEASTSHSTTSVPEPGSLSLLVAGALLLHRRRQG
jgi:hypothetical protein